MKIILAENRVVALAEKYMKSIYCGFKPMAESHPDRKIFTPHGSESNLLFTYWPEDPSITISGTLANEMITKLHGFFGLDDYFTITDIILEVLLECYDLDHDTYIEDLEFPYKDYFNMDNDEFEVKFFSD